MATSCFDRNGEPIDMHEWAALLDGPTYRRVALSEIGPVLVSTVWVGIDQSFGLDGGPPLIFETMVFCDGFSLDGEAWRWATESTARTGHQAVVTLVNVELVMQT